MSAGETYRLDEAENIAGAFVNEIRGAYERVLVAGSVRRKKPIVGDIEIVVQERTAGSVWRLLDEMLDAGAISQWQYTNGTRWGDKYRGVAYRRTKVEVFAADADNYGFISWLRTGPGDANMLVMSELAAMKSPVRMRKGYVWEVAYPPDGEMELVKRLHVPDEGTLFALLGTRWIPSVARCADVYRLSPETRPDYLVDFWAADDVQPVRQKTLI